MAVFILIGKRPVNVANNDGRITSSRNSNAVEPSTATPRNNTQSGASSITLPPDSTVKKDAAERQVNDSDTSPQPLKKSVTIKATNQKVPAENEVEDTGDSGETSYGPGYLTKDETGQQVILYGAMADEARARDKEKKVKK